jgi:hypothetical protein
MLTYKYFGKEILFSETVEKDTAQKHYGSLSLSNAKSKLKIFFSYVRAVYKLSSEKNFYLNSK